MEQYYYSVETQDGETSVIIVGQNFYNKFGYISDQTSAHYDDDFDPKYGDCAFTKAECNEFGLKYIDKEFLALYDEWLNSFGVGEACESIWEANDEFIAYLEAHPNFTQRDLEF